MFQHNYLYSLFSLYFTDTYVYSGIATLSYITCTAKSKSFLPAYTRSDLTDNLHEKFGFITDYEIITKKNLKKIFKEIKK